MFADVVPAPAKKPKVKRAALQEEPTVKVSFGLPGEVEKTVDVKRPSHPCDRLAIRLDAEALDCVFSFLRLSGFIDVSEQKKADLPAGVWWNKQRGLYMVPHVGEDGKKRTKCYKDLSEATEATASSEHSSRDLPLLDADAVGNLSAGSAP